MSAPQLRFKDKLGRSFPAWETKNIADVCNKVMDGTHFSPKSKEGPRKYLTSKNIRNDGLSLADCSYISEEEHHEIYKKCPVKKGDILLTKDGANTGNCCINTLDEEVSLLSSVSVLSGKDQVLNNQFLLQIFQGSIGANYIRNAMAGQAISRVTLKKINNFSFRFPCFQEQTKIASFLTAVDEKISQLTKKCGLLTQYKKGVAQHIFSQALRFKDDDGREFPEWDKVTFGDIAKFSKGKGISKADIATEGKTPCIRYGELYTEYGETIQDVKSRTNLNPLSLVLSNANDVIIPASGETQLDIATAACVMKSGVALGGDLNIIKSSANGVFLAYYLNNQMKLDIAKLSQGNSVVHLYPSQLKQLKLTIPGLAEQTKIANFLTDIDEKITNTQSQLATAKQYKQGLVQQMFV